MGLSDTQKLLARLYVDSDLRKRFSTDPSGVGAEFGLSDAEAAEMGGLSLPQAEFFSRSLKFKRLAEVRRLLPRTAEAMGRPFSELFLSYAEREIPAGIAKHQHDAVAFAAHLQLSEIPAEPPWTRDLARYEAAWLQANRCGVCCLVRLFRWDLRLIVNPSKAQLAAVPRRRLVGLWLRLRPWGAIRHCLIPAGFSRSPLV